MLNALVEASALTAEQTGSKALIPLTDGDENGSRRRAASDDAAQWGIR